MRGVSLLLPVSFSSSLILFQSISTVSVRSEGLCQAFLLGPWVPQEGHCPGQQAGGWSRLSVTGEAICLDWLPTFPTELPLWKSAAQGSSPKRNQVPESHRCPIAKRCCRVCTRRWLAPAACAEVWLRTDAAPAHGTRPRS